MIFKIIALLILFVAVYFLYRIAYPVPQETKKINDAPQKRETVQNDVVKKIRFVRPNHGQPKTTRTTPAKEEILEKNPYIFAPETEKDGSGIIPPDKLDEVFEDEINPDDLDIDADADDDADDEIDLEAEEELEQRNRVEGQSAMLAEGLNFDDLHDVAEVVKEQPETVSEKTAATIAALEHTDMFELLASGDEGKANWIKSVVRFCLFVVVFRRQKTGKSLYFELLLYCLSYN